MAWLKDVKYGYTAGASRAPGSRVGGALLVHPEFKGLLFRKVASKNDLLANCNGFMVFTPTGVPILGAVGETAKAKYEAASLTGYRALVRSGSAMVTDVSQSSQWGDLGLMQYMGLSKTVLSSAMSGQMMGWYGATPKQIGSGGDEIISYPWLDVASSLPALKTYTQAECANMHILGIVCQADDGVFSFGSLATPITDHVLKDPIQYGYVFSRMEMGTVGDAVRAYAPTWLSAAPSDVKSYLAGAINWFLSTADAKEKTWMCYGTTWGRMGNYNQRGVDHGLMFPSAYVFSAKDPNSSADPIKRRRGFWRPTSADRNIWAPCPVWQLSANTTEQSAIFKSYSAGHALALGMEDGAAGITPPTVYGDSFESVMNGFGTQWNVIHAAAQATVQSSTFVKPDGNLQAEKTLAQVDFNSVFTADLTGCTYRPKIFIDLQKAAIAIYRKAEADARDDG